MKSNLEGLSNSEKYHDSISIDNQNASDLKNILNTMLLIRKTE
jgi:hypothetical protein